MAKLEIETSEFPLANKKLVALMAGNQTSDNPNSNQSRNHEHLSTFKKDSVTLFDGIVLSRPDKGS